VTNPTGTTRTTRAQRMAMPLARAVVRDLAVEHGACIRPIQLRRTNRDSGEVDQVLVPCGHTLASVCPSCAERAKTLRAVQCREGWHLEDEPDIEPDPASEDQKWWITQRAEAQQVRDLLAADGQDTTDFDELITELDAEITKAGIRGRAASSRGTRRHRSTRRRQDAPDLPRRKVSPRTVGKTYTAPDGKTFRPSLFITLTCPSCGRVGEDGAPADPASYNYGRAARDALAFAALFDRFIQNLRRYLGYGSGAKDYGPWHSEDPRVPLGRHGRAPACSHADPASQQDRRHDGDLHRGPLGRYARRAQEARAVAGQLGHVAVLQCCTDINNGQSQDRNWPVIWVGGRYWDRTSDLLGVNEALSR
jgi:hypothetical protein